MTLRGALREAIRQAVNDGYTRFLAGGALGFDTMAAETVLELRDEGNLPITLTLVIPHPEQTSRWAYTDVLRYKAIRKAANEVIETADHYFRGCMQVRNRRLVDESSRCIAYLRKDTGGTAYTVAYAEKHAVPVVKL